MVPSVPNSEPNTGCIRNFIPCVRDPEETDATTYSVLLLVSPEGLPYALSVISNWSRLAEVDETGFMLRSDVPKLVKSVKDRHQ